MSISSTKICDTLHGVLSFVKLKKGEKQSWSSVTFSKVAACLRPYQKSIVEHFGKKRK